MPDIADVLSVLGGDTSGGGSLNRTDLTSEQGRLGALSQAADAKRAESMGKIRGTTTDLMSALQESTDELRRAHESQWNLPLLAFSAGMLRTRPGVAGNFLTEFGQGLDSAIPVIQQQRMKDQDFWKQISELQQAKAQAGVLPEKMEADYQGKLSEEAQKLLSQLNVAGMRSDKPFAVPGTGEVIYPNHFGPGKHGIKAPGSANIVPQTAGAAPPTTPKPAEAPNWSNAPTPEQTDVLKKMNPTFDGVAHGFAMNWDKLTELARTDPEAANAIYKALMYESDPIAFLSKRGQMGQMSYEKIENEMRKFDPNWSYSDLQAAIKNRNAPEWNTKTNIPSQQLNTGVGHMGALIEMYAKLGNDPNQLANAIRNWVKEKTGSSDVTNQAVTAKFVGDEVAKYLAGGQGSALQDREELAKLLSGKLGAQQARDAVNTMLGLMEKKDKELAFQKTEMLKNRRVYTTLMSPDAKAEVEKIRGSQVAKIDGKEHILVPGVTVINGMLYKGGSPNSENSWVKQ